ncbi:MAG: hypothetical protein QGH15_20545 [Kiritimatiellia bacterium]|nr:hypothetical protein [Kiritimatiellia bacterium]
MRKRTIWSAPAERSGDGALVAGMREDKRKKSGVDATLCHRTPNVRAVASYAV